MRESKQGRERWGESERRGDDRRYVCGEGISEGRIRIGEGCEVMVYKVTVEKHGEGGRDRWYEERRHQKLVEKHRLGSRNVCACRERVRGEGIR